MDYARGLVERAVGKNYPGLVADAHILPGQSGYKYPGNLSKIVTGIGPHCYGLPVMNKDGYIAPHVLFPDGTQSVWMRNPNVGVNTNLADALFGQSLSSLLSSLSGGTAP